jgi:hypothetical protein
MLQNFDFLTLFSNLTITNTTSVLDDKDHV